jgi:hypothetical protein
MRRKSCRLAAAFAVVLCFVPAPLAAQENSLDRCAVMVEVAELVMRLRQNGWTMDDLVQVERVYPPSLRGMVELASIMAFREPRHEAPEQQEEAIRNAGVLMEQFCGSAD